MWGAGSDEPLQTGFGLPAALNAAFTCLCLDSHLQITLVTTSGDRKPKQLIPECHTAKQLQISRLTGDAQAASAASRRSKSGLDAAFAGKCWLRQLVAGWRLDHEHVRDTALIHTVLSKIVNVPEEVRRRPDCVHGGSDWCVAV